MSRKPTARANAIAAFRLAHDLTFGKPSGSTTWKITVSKDPRKWRYESNPFTYHYEGERPLQYITVTACISWYWAEAGFFPHEEAPWAEAIAGRQILVLGASPTAAPAPAPADTALLLSCVESGGIYRGRFTRRIFLALGNHSLLCENPADPAPELIEHIRQASIERLNGVGWKFRNINWRFADEFDTWV